MVTWHIVPGMTVQETQLSATGAGLQDVEKITYQFDDCPMVGQMRSITIPVSLYNPDNVKAAVQQDAEIGTAV